MRSRLKPVSFVLGGAVAGFLVAATLPNVFNTSEAHSSGPGKKLNAQIAALQKEVNKLKQKDNQLNAKIENNRKRSTQNFLARKRFDKIWGKRLDKWKKLPLH